MKELTLDASPRNTTFQRIPRLEKVELSRPTLVSILRLLPNLSSLGLRSIHITKYHMTEDEDAIWRSRKVPLTTLKLVGLGTFRSAYSIVAEEGNVCRIVSIVPSVSELHLTGMDFPNGPSLHLPLQRRLRHRIKKLYINECRTFAHIIQGLKSVCNLDSLEQLSILSAPKEVGSIAQFLGQNRSMSCLDIRLRCPLPGHISPVFFLTLYIRRFDRVFVGTVLRGTPISLIKCTGLTSLILEVQMASTIAKLRDAWFILANFLRNIPPSIRTITVQVLPGTGDSLQKFPSGLEGQNWEPVANALESLTGLETLTFELVSPVPPYSDKLLDARDCHTRLTKVLEGKLAFLYERNMLRILSGIVTMSGE
ncbi:hypothetical protein NLI96_g1846 [Meripilus lineatus]|uniref:F-box domain-containing protein n=1 Tax=Meripilus lineatus TaxID=2056292 RepID=A0AAD5YHZ3_9APHY|nr:hypothetical protein NLI96_g1846 [Physisporinus lineatus]